MDSMSEDGKLVANRNSIGKWETFNLVKTNKN